MPRFDDWLYPQPTGEVFKPPKPKERWLIQRERTIVCTWFGDGPPREWALWSSHDSREERDDELKRLRETTLWRLRPAHQPLHGRVQVEDDEADLLRRLDKVRRDKN